MLDRETLGKLVREVWVEFAKEQHDPNPSHLVGWDDLDEANKEVDMRIGERVAHHVLTFMMEQRPHAVWETYRRLSAE